MTLGHATAEMLANYAAGSLSDGMALLVAGHLLHCPACRCKLARLEAVCGALLAETDPSGCAAPDVSTVLGRLETSGSGNAPAPEPPLDLVALLPCPMRAALAGCARGAGWVEVMPGLTEHPLDGFAPDRLTLIRADPGFRMPHHGHAGAETALVLRGALRDGGHVYGPGELVIADHRVEHAPEVVGRETCVSLFLFGGEAALPG